jgi:monoterpene epsilon-lactone hydrolase
VPSPEFVQVLAMIRSRPVPPGLSLDVLRPGFDALWSATPVPADVTREPIVAGGRPAERLTAPAAERARAVLYLHGGGYVLGSVRSHRELAARIGRAARAPLVIVDYRLAPEHPFPAAVDDAVAAYRGLLDQGLAPARVAIVGDSAGGGLAIATLVALRDAGVALPGAAVCLSPWVDLALEAESFVTNAATDPTIQRERLLPWARQYLGGVDAKHPLASPVHADLAGLPPLLLQYGTAETLRDDSLRLAARAHAVGVEAVSEPWDDMIHVFQMYGTLPEAARAIERIGAFVREKTSASK